MAKYLEDKRRRLQGQQEAPAQKQPVQYTPKAAPAVQPQAAAPATAEKQTYTAPKAPAEKQAATPAPTSTTTAPVQTAGSDVVAQAQEYLNQQLGGYKSQYGSQITDLVAQIQNRPKFEYDVNSDPLYLQLRDIWKQDGLMAMEDTMGQAAQLTGGYGNSHAQMAGQQVYNNYLRQVNEMVPELKETARADYDADTDVLLRNLGLLMDQDNTDYARYMDELNRQYQMDRDALADQRYNQEWEYQTGRDQLADQRYQDELAYGREQDQYQRQQQSYDRLLELIIATGYKPTAEELAAAGMTEAEAKAWRGYYTANQAVGGGSSGGGGGNPRYYKTGDDYGDGPINEDEDDKKPVTEDESGNRTFEMVREDLYILAGNGANRNKLVQYANEAYKDGEINSQQLAAIINWANCLSYPTQSTPRNPNPGTPSGGPGRNNRYDALH